MQLFAAVLGDETDGPDVAGALAAAAQDFPELDASTLSEFRSSDGRLVFAAMTHAPAAASNRRYLARLGSVAVAFDGLPVDGQAGFHAADAAGLLRHWDELPGRLDGQFAAIRVDTEACSVELLLDALGLVPVYTAVTASSTVISNSVEAVRRLARASSLDLLAASTMLTLGWSVSDRTLLEPVRVLAAGRLHRWTPGRHTERSVLDSELVAPVRRRERIDERHLAETLLRLTRAAAEDEAPVQCPVTAGRDARVCLALLLAAQVPVELYTFGTPGDVDVEAGRHVATSLGLPQRTFWPDADQVDWPVVARRFVRQTDGLASFEQLQDILEPPPTPGRVALKASGIGGEMSRTVTGVLDGVTGTIPGIGRSNRLARTLLTRKLHGFGGLATPTAMAESRRYVEDFAARRQAEGWSGASTAEAWYLYERIGRHASTAPRRSGPTADLFSPFCSLAYISYAYALPVAERYNEVSHRRLLALLSPTLLHEPFEQPWPPQRPRLAAPLATAQVARAASSTVTGRLGHQPGRPTAQPKRPPRPAWFERDLELHREVAMGDPGSPLWTVVDRERLGRLFSAEPAERLLLRAGFERVLALAWYLQALL